jgi:hypothetical protein
MRHQPRANFRKFSPATKRKSDSRSRRGSQESGYALLVVLFMVLLLLISSTAAVSDLRTERRRQREEEMVWRGNQYVRAIRLYFHKTGHYPQNLDDLEQGLPDLHFLRASAYKDPLNSTDGSWRFIYVNATGQIIGSVKYASLQQMALTDLNAGQLPGTNPGQLLLGAQPILPVAPATNLAGQPAGGGGTQPGQTSPAAPPAPPVSPDSALGQTTNPAQPTQTVQTSAPTAPQPPQPGLSAFGTPVAQQPTGPVDGPVLGAFLTGVGSKVDQASVRVYKGGTDYNQWEFIWNPIEDQARAVQQGLGQIQTPNLLGPAGTLGMGGVTPAGANPSPFGTSAPGAANPSPFGAPSPGASQPGPTPAPQPNPLP